jgi:hypothetical protein
MRNTADEAIGKPIILWSQAISDVSAVNPQNTDKQKNNDMMKRKLSSCFALIALAGIGRMNTTFHFEYF